MKKLLLLITCTVFFMAGALAQTTHYVGQNGDDTNGGTSLADAWLTIQHAIDVADAGDIIIVGLGIYREFLQIDKTITIEGVVAGGERAVIRPPVEVDKKFSGVLLSVNLLNKIDIGDDGPVVTVSGLEIDGGLIPGITAGIYAYNSTITLDNVIIRNILNILHQDLKTGFLNAYGIRLNGGQLLVENSLIEDIRLEPEDMEPYFVKASGIHAVGIYTEGVQNLAVKNSRISGVYAAYGDASGISVHGGWDFNKTDILPLFEITGNTIEQITALHYAAGIYSKGTNSLLIQENEVGYVGGESKAFGIVLEHLPLNVVRIEDVDSEKVEVMSRNEVMGNTISHIFLTHGGTAKAEKFIMASFGIHAMTSGELLIQGNGISSTPLQELKRNAFGPQIGIYLTAEDAHLLDNEITHCVMGLMTIFSRQLMVKDNTIYNPMIGVMALDIPFFGVAKSARYDFPFELPPLPEMDFAKAIPNMGSLSFIGNIITGRENMSYVGMETMLGEMYSKEGELELEMGARFIAQDNLIENFMYGISLGIGGGQLAEINGQNTIQNNEYGVAVYHRDDRRKIALDPLVFINHNTIQGNGFGVINENYEEYDDGNNGDNGGVFKGEVMAPFIDAKFNFWGTEDGPGFVLDGSDRKVDVPGNGVSFGVLYSPWLGSVPDTPPGQMTYYVDDSGSIQDAIDLASDGDIIRVLNGYYQGDVVVGQGDGLTLYPGNSPACVVIDGDLTVASGNTLFIEMDGTFPVCELMIIDKKGSGAYTQVSVFGHVDLGGITLDLSLGFAPQIGDEFEIIYSDYPITGMFSQGESITVEYEGLLYTFDILYNIADGGELLGKQDGTYYMVVLDLVQMDEPMAVPLSGWAIALGMLLMAGFVAFRFRLNADRA